MYLSKTPNFDKELDRILNDIKPHQKTCKQCRRIFKIFQEDIKFYKKLRVPLPALCHECRMQRRFGFYNNILKFYRKQDARTNEKIISTFHPESPYKIYNLEYWWSDKWGGEDYARDYDFNKSFFAQFQELNLTVPHPAITHYWKRVRNSPYTIAIIDSENCYLTALSGSLENVHYSYWVSFCRDSLELFEAFSCENCYEIINSAKCYNSHFCEDCYQCVDSFFLYGCSNCQNCFACTNLRHKSYCFFNEQLSKEEYQQRIRGINLGDRDVLDEYKEKFKVLLKKTIRRNLTVDIKNINCVGDRLWGSKDCYLVFRTTNEIENVRYGVDLAWHTTDSMDVWVVGPNVSLSYESIEVLESSNVKFSFFIKNGMDLEYCLNCTNCQYCFGCSGLRNKKYYILNKPYSKEDYWQKIDQIKIKMLRDNEYGEFFPLSMSLFPYNDTYAAIEFPLSKEQILENGWQWHDEPKIPADLKGLDLIDAKDVPKDIKNIQDDILNKAIVCEATGKPFRIIKQELEFYRKHNLPVPIKHPNQRLFKRLQATNPLKLWKSNCLKCDNEMFTSYPPEKQKELKIYCNKCFLKEIV